MFTQTADQDLLEATTEQYLAATYPPARLRELARRDSTFDAALWKQGAELGWTTLLVAESAGGGSVSGNGLADLVAVAFQFGRHAAPGPLIGTNIVAAALGRWGSKERHGAALAELLDGGATAAWGYAPRLGRRAPAGVRAARSGDRVVLDGTVPHVETGAPNGYLLVAAVDDDGTRSHHLVPLDAPGVHTAPLGGLDLTRRYAAVALRGVALPATSRVGEPGTADDHDEELLDLTAVLQAAQIVGAMERAFAMTLRWTGDRYSFGRPLGSYQEIKHRMADLRTQLEAGAAVVEKAARRVGDGAGDARSWASAAKAYAGRLGPEVIQDCVQLHGGIGVTFEHDLHLYLRRATVDAQSFGTPAYFSERLVRLVEAGMQQEETA
ncbi:acyl-CoA dehydrogenase family protein [Frankia sp. CNm7]|uniref:Acyl-CoA dehydrogenase family protein n=1 Tax=Frankia nepalensis TaxID=1836974 RepID=A0A937UPI6_9ACTN|nr:acyl-CoA dehydrogenase family protein [Frankia nepalensis]MBL7502289.1 acyl-CoA dehydrogenase family protein [Frankia nepalensis]MBL7515056.1 acyl-CoA dehydrogenase family protein [Frankia nepalensis]MBL7522306.1 acyl-CoA dehydrogenase family protein [Frankia nepalensis]MBL7625606.1 acyl-CoA dehydrogenase family protein [Frankia nepalensis]